MGVKLAEMTENDGVTHRAWLWHCPGCDGVHQCDDRWAWNGSKVAPTFRASVLVRMLEQDGVTERERCHSYVTDGRIAFLSDCTHELKGQEVELPDWDERHPGPYGGARKVSP